MGQAAFAFFSGGTERSQTGGPYYCVGMVPGFVTLILVVEYIALRLLGFAFDILTDVFNLGALPFVGEWLLWLLQWIPPLVDFVADLAIFFMLIEIVHRSVRPVWPTEMPSLLHLLHLAVTDPAVREREHDD